ncbi:MAG: hypothetical protein ACJ76N_09510 [Thermoanaerobaculia bacterium]
MLVTLQSVIAVKPMRTDWPAQPALPPSWTAAVQISSLAPLRRSVQEGKKVPAIPERLL